MCRLLFSQHALRLFEGLGTGSLKLRWNTDEAHSATMEAALQFAKRVGVGDTYHQNPFFTGFFVIPLLYRIGTPDDLPITRVQDIDIIRRPQGDEGGECAP